MILVGHTAGVLKLGKFEEWEKAEELLGGKDVVVLAHSPGNSEVLLAGSYGQGLFRSGDGGESWQHIDLEVEYVRDIRFSTADLTGAYLGSEPAELYRSEDAGLTWKNLEVRRLPEAEKWSLPYSPRSGALRTIVLDGQNPWLIHAGVEQGGVVTSVDGGKTWSINHETVDRDVHWLSRHPEQPEQMFAATGDGLFRTADGGKKWSKLIDEYTRAVLVHPRQSQTVLAGPAGGVGEEGRVVRSDDGGRNWGEASEGIKTPMEDMVEHFLVDPNAPDTIHMISSEGRLFVSPLEKMRWREIDTGDIDVQHLDFL